MSTHSNSIPLSNTDIYKIIKLVKVEYRFVVKRIHNTCDWNDETIKSESKLYLSNLIMQYINYKFGNNFIVDPNEIPKYIPYFTYDEILKLRNSKYNYSKFKKPIDYGNGVYWELSNYKARINYLNALLYFLK